MNRLPSTLLAVLFATAAVGCGVDGGAEVGPAPTAARLVTFVPDLRPPDVGGGDGEVRHLYKQSLAIRA